ncbi:hypothetical protein ES332_D08G006900v1 [Gossypium tomentosum]|uniref:Uncharacterized protein n=1 Tax=Gossypium tomentosum TaxID=34277 RepID=A0A5D2JP51_GOSTO|nr:hypothetical protein ES332_D08G006900v1 [Gossypium tomentosum]
MFPSPFKTQTLSHLIFSPNRKENQKKKNEQTSLRRFLKNRTKRDLQILAPAPTVTERTRIRLQGIWKPYGDVARLGAAHGGVARSNDARAKAHAQAGARHVGTKALVAAALEVVCC